MVWFQSHDETVSSGLAQLRRDCRKFILEKDEITDLVLYSSKPHQLQTRCLFWPCAVLLAMHLWNNVPQPPTCRPLLQVWSPLLADQDKSWDWKNRRSHLHHPVSEWGIGNRSSTVCTNKSSCATNFLAQLKHIFGTQTTAWKNWWCTISTMQ